MKYLKYLKAPLMLILVPIDYIAWNAIMADKYGKITLLKSIERNWAMLIFGDNVPTEIRK